MPKVISKSIISIKANPGLSKVKNKGVQIKLNTKCIAINAYTKNGLCLIDDLI
jgi:hypothetical protein